MVIQHQSEKVKVSLGTDDAHGKTDINETLNSSNSKRKLFPRSFSFKGRTKSSKVFDELDEITRSSVIPEPKYMSNFGSSSNYIITDISLTRQLFLDAYSKGKWNLSSVPAPPFFGDTQLLKPPNSFQEPMRLKAVDAYANHARWKDVEELETRLGKVSRRFKCAGGSISLITDRYQVIKALKHFQCKEIPRSLSIDSHAILSHEFFILLDATKDWRIKNNPLVKGPPYIKFYVGVPLVSRSGQAVGVLAIFDVYARQDFSAQDIAYLRNEAQEIMALLNSTPLNKALIKPINGKISLGRATSQRFASSSDVVFEKDGSGSAYSQNTHFRLNRTGLDSQERSVSELAKAMVSSGDPKNAASILCKRIHETVNFKFVYVMEIRVVEPYTIASELLPLKNDVPLEGFTYMANLKRNGEEKISTRVLGAYGFNPDSLNFEPMIHYKAFVSEFGLSYKSYEPNVRFRSGICMPFLKREAKIVRQVPVTVSTKVVHGAPIEVFLKSSGYLVAGFHQNMKVITDDDIDQVMKYSSVLRQIFLLS